MTLLKDHMHRQVVQVGKGSGRLGEQKVAQKHTGKQAKIIAVSMDEQRNKASTSHVVKTVVPRRLSRHRLPLEW